VKPVITCRKCERRLHYVEPTIYLSHAGTDFWTKYGERRWKPTICMACRSKIGANAQRFQADPSLQSNRQHRTEKD
jgi:hypothetical protein